MRKIVCSFLIGIGFYGLYAQTELEPTETDALLTVLVTNMKGIPSKGDQVSFVSKKSGKTYSGVSGNDGKFKILVPKGDSLSVRFKSFEKDSSYRTLAIPGGEDLITFNYTIRYDLPRTITLESVFFNSNKSELRPESFAALNNLAELMQSKKTLVIEISGHTDDVGDDAANLRLSQGRADAVKAYLVKKGIAANRVQAVGYGETRPIAPNETPEGKQKNRRTEVRIVSE